MTNTSDNAALRARVALLRQDLDSVDALLRSGLDNIAAGQLERACDAGARAARLVLTSNGRASRSPSRSPERRAP